MATQTETGTIAHLPDIVDHPVREGQGNHIPPNEWDISTLRLHTLRLIILHILTSAIQTAIPILLEG
jgi:hypothetical protein